MAAKQYDAGYLLEEIPKAIEQTLEGVTRVATLGQCDEGVFPPGHKGKNPLGSKPRHQQHNYGCAE